MCPHRPPKDDVERLENLIEGLMDVDEDELPSREQIHAEAKAHGIDFDAWAAQIERKVATHVEAERRVREEELTRQREAAAARFAARAAEPLRPRDEQIAILHELLRRTAPEEVSLHFLKFKEATDEDLARMVGELRHLVEQREKREKKKDG
jgi:hypothetical protein